MFTNTLEIKSGFSMEVLSEGDFFTLPIEVQKEKLWKVILNMTKEEKDEMISMLGEEEISWLMGFVSEMVVAR